MAQSDRIFSPEDSLKALNEAAKNLQDEFVLKVLRRTHLSSPMTIIATFEGATVQHFTSPELWLPALAGGGKFFLQGYHQTNLNQAIGSFITVPIDGDERDVDIAATKRPDWRGPAKLIFPKEATPRQQADMPLYALPQSPSAPGPSDSATRTAWPRSAGGGVVRQQYDEGELAFGPRAHALEAERRKLEQEKLEAERERHKADVAAREAAHKAELAAVQSELRMEIRSLRTEKPTGPDPMVEFMKMQAEERRAAEAARREDARLERERQDRMDARAAEERKAERERQDRLEARIADDRRADRERTDKLLEKMAGDKKDPLELIKQVTDLVGKKGGDSEMLMKSMNNMMEVQSTVMGSTMDFVEHVSRLNLGGGSDEPGWVKGVDRMMKGIGKFIQAGARGGPVFPQQQLPAQQPQQPQQPQPTPAQQPQPPQTETQQPVIDQLVGGILAHYDPAMVAKALITYYQDPTVQKAIADAGGDPEKALISRLPSNWAGVAPQNAAYLKSLLAELEKQIQAAGFFDDGADDGPEEEGGDDEGGEDDGGDDADEGDETEE